MLFRSFYFWASRLRLIFGKPSACEKRQSTGELRTAYPGQDRDAPVEWASGWRISPYTGCAPRLKASATIARPIPRTKLFGCFPFSPVRL